jgi:pantetheine-phosphate adenylyltransferase
MSSLKVAIYPGTFDPITKGHLDIVIRASRLVDKLIIAVAVNAGKKPIFTLQERLTMAVQEVHKLKENKKDENIEVKAFDNLLVDFAYAHKAVMIVRGLRAVSDFDYEFQMAGINKAMNSQIETIFLVASEGSQFISSTYIKEIALLGGDIRPFVSEEIATNLLAKIKQYNKPISL